MMKLVEKYKETHTIVIGMFDSGLYALYDDFSKYRVFFLKCIWSVDCFTW